MRDRVVSNALSIDKRLKRLTTKERESVLSILWFHYVGKNYDWRWVRLKRASKEI